MKKKGYVNAELQELTESETEEDNNEKILAVQNLYQLKIKGIAQSIIY
jgi:hypothetical protein